MTAATSEGIGFSFAAMEPHVPDLRRAGDKLEALLPEIVECFRLAYPACAAFEKWLEADDHNCPDALYETVRAVTGYGKMIDLACYLHNRVTESLERGRDMVADTLPEWMDPNWSTEDVLR